MSNRPAGGTVFKDLCIDAGDVAASAAFWSRALGLDVQERNGSVLLGDGVDEHTVWVNAVPEPRSVKNRVHLDVLTPSVSALAALRASVLDDSRSWTVMADPEGAEFCALVRPPERLPEYRLDELVVDAADPQLVATWWADRFGVAAQQGAGQPFWFLEGAGGLPCKTVFNPVPEAKTVKNRVHWDVWGTTSELVAAGATLLRARDDEIRWDVLADPEGNEFCVFARD